MSWAGRRVLVTGHTGFKGGWLCTWLARLGAEVAGFALAPAAGPSLFALGRIADVVDDVRGDVRDAGAVAAAVRRARPDVVFHLAAEPIVRRSLRRPAETMAVNVLGTAHLLDGIREHAPDAAVVVVTSDKCYADRGTGRPYREDDPLGGADPYSASKAAQEHVAAAYRSSYGLAIATARAGNVIGGGDWAEDRLVPDLVRAAGGAGRATIRNPASVRPWQHVLNPLAGYLRLAEGLIDGADVREAWNFGPEPEDERPVSWLVERFAERWPGELVITVEDEVASLESPALRLDSAKARERLGWTPLWGLADGLEATVDWYAAQAAGADARVLMVDEIDRLSRARTR